MSIVPLNSTASKTSNGSDVREVIKEYETGELIFAVVGAVGAGSSLIATTLESELKQKNYDAKILKASECIEDWLKSSEYNIDTTNDFTKVESYQNAGDEMRSKDSAAIAIKLIEKIREYRASQTGQAAQTDEPVMPDGKPRAYILDSLKNPAEVQLLRMVYKEAFCLVGVVCDHKERKKRLSTSKFQSATLEDINSFMERDEDDVSKSKHGQHVSKTFHLSDFFIDNTPQKLTDDGKRSNPDWDIPDRIGRLIDAITHTKIIRPDSNEMGMYYAYNSKLRSSCLSRQVGSSLLDQYGNLLAVGANEVPKAGGGTYGDGFSPLFEFEGCDHRCFHSEICSNTKQQNIIIDQIIDQIPELKSATNKDNVRKALKKSPIGRLIEFSRAVHAEMDVLLSAARQGSVVVGSKMYVTTYPCHNCARHIVAAGVDEVHFIEPYLKSKATELHGDSITTTEDGWLAPSQITIEEQEDRKKKAAGSDITPKVLFKPFRGIAPNLYKRTFLKDRDLKDNNTGSMNIGSSDRSLRPESLKASYCDIETRLVNTDHG